MKRVHLLFLPALLSSIGISSTCAAGGTVSWQCTTNQSPWVDKGQIPTTAPTGDKTLHIEVNHNDKLQEITAWGGCFNEKGWDALQALSEEDRQGVLKSLFDPQTGLRLNFCRTPIGASDFAMSPYSLDDADTDDYSIAHFSIDRDKERLIPYIKAALALNPDLKLWAVPWSPPGWMKTSHNVIGGSINADPEVLDALALYFEKYVQAYQAEGIPLVMVMPQNEPTQNTNYPSCLWKGTQLQTFIRDHLGPKFKADAVKCDIWLGTFTNSDYSYVGPTVDDPQTLAFVKGASFQWTGNKACARVHKDHPDVPLMQSETICGNGHNDWKYAESQFDLIKTYMDAGVSSYMLWNMVLDEAGRSTGNWVQCAPITVNKSTKAITYNPQYYIFKHFSYYVRPGAHYLAVTGNYGDKAAFLNSDGEEILEVKNSSTQDLKVSITFDGEEIDPILPAHSVSTFHK